MNYIMRKKEDKKQRNRRYYLHRCVKKLDGVSIQARKRTVCVPCNIELTEKLKELQGLKYNIQTEIT